MPIRSPDDLAPYADEPLLADFDPERLSRDGADAHWLLLDRGVAAHCSLWWRGTAPAPDGPLGAIGHFAARDVRSATVLLDHACERLVARGCVRAVGPMDGSTWRRYRYVVERGEDPPFLLEPDHPDAYPHYWRRAGFTPLTHYRSAVQEDLTLEPFALDRVLARIAAGGIQLRPLRRDAIEAELRGVYRVTLHGFAAAPLYTSISEEAYLELYRPLLPLILPELCLLAEAGDELMGYLFALPDALQAERGERVDTVVVKTVAVLPEMLPRGLGSALVGALLRSARELGFRRAVHALMHERNASLRISRSYGARTIRRYALFGRTL